MVIWDGREKAMKNSQPDENDTEQTPTSPDEESLQELKEETDKTMAEARKETARAEKTLHDQILPKAESGVEGDFEDEEGTPSKDDTRGAWPDWSD